jgi:hypothetical protein
MYAAEITLICDGLTCQNRVPGTTTSLKSFVANLSDEGIRESMKALERFASNREQWVYKAGRWFCAKRREEAGDLPAQHRPNC